jgi:hypothetical protein
MLWSPSSATTSHILLTSRRPVWTRVVDLGLAITSGGWRREPFTGGLAQAVSEATGAALQVIRGG